MLQAIAARGAQARSFSRGISAFHQCLRRAGFPVLQRVIDENQITHIFPAHDDVLLALSENASSLQAKIVASPESTCKVARFKSATIHRLGNRLPTPRIYNKHPRWTTTRSS